MITLGQAVLQRGQHILLDKVDLTVYANDRVGLIGRNGSGKTSLFKLLLGELAVDGGDYHRPADWRLSIMRQETKATDCSALDYVLNGDTRYRELEQQIADSQDDGVRLGELYQQWEDINGYEAASIATRLLHGLGFGDGDYQRLVSDFSGGWRIRLNLAQALMTPSDLLLLDEPTNHLDMDATLWLERWLLQYSGTLVIISHDRDFLDNIVTRIVHIDQQQLVAYKGNYSSFETVRALRLAEQQAAFVQQQAQIAHMEDFIRRFKAKATKAKQAQSRIKALDRMEKVAPLRAESPFSFSIQAQEKMSRPLVTISDASVGYSDKPTLSKLNLSLLPETKIGLLGANGQGKSTFIKLITRELEPQAGEVLFGEHCKVGYFSQHQQAALDLEASPMLHIQRLDADNSKKPGESAIRTFLGSFNFQSDRVFEQVKIFSGGEKARLALALIVWQKPNVLLLDEPTNHLDLEMREALTWAIQGFEGALVLISHDRHLLRSCCDDYWLVGEGRCKEFDGSLADYEQLILQQKPAEAKSSTSAGEQGGSADNKKAKRQQAAEARANIQPLRKKIKQLEKKIDQFQKSLDTINEKLADNDLYQAGNKETLEKLLKEQGEVKNQLEEAEMEWLDCSEQMQELESS